MEVTCSYKSWLIYTRLYVGTGYAVLQLVEALRFRFPMVSLEYFIDIILSAALCLWG